jgi:hypothetical protein
MKNYGIPLQYACFECRKCFKRKQFSATYNRFMTGAQQIGQAREAEEFNTERDYRCPDCGGPTYFMGQDFKAPKKADIKGWKKAKEFIESGKVYYRGSQNE